MVELNKTEEISKEFLLLLETSMWVLLPAVAILCAAPEALVDTLFGYKEFDQEAVRLTSLALIGAAPALWTGVVFPLINRVFNAQGRNNVLLRVVVVGTIGNVVLAYVLSQKIGLAGVGLAQGVSQFAMIIYLIPKLPGNITLKAMGRILLWWSLAALMFLMLYFIPRPSAAPVEFGLILACGIIIWIIFSLLVPTGRRNLSQSIKIFNRLRKKPQ